MSVSRGLAAPRNRTGGSSRHTGKTSRVSNWMKVDFPAPLGPRRATCSPSRSSKSSTLKIVREPRTTSASCIWNRGAVELLLPNALPLHVRVAVSLILRRSPKPQPSHAVKASQLYQLRNKAPSCDYLKREHSREGFTTYEAFTAIKASICCERLSCKRASYEETGASLSRICVASDTEGPSDRKEYGPIQ